MPGSATSTPLQEQPIHDTPILGMTARPKVTTPIQFGSGDDFWVEYPSGLVDVSRLGRLGNNDNGSNKVKEPPPREAAQVDIEVNGERVVRVDKAATAIVIIDMQNFFLHPDLRSHPKGLKCVQPLMDVVPALRSMGSKILWVNWGLTEHELTTLPPSLIRGFKKPTTTTNGSGGGFGSELPGNFGRLLMRDAYNSELYGPLQEAFEHGRKEGSDFWIHKNRMSGLWGYQTALDLFLKENGIKTLLFAGVNADQCVLGTLVDAYFRGYDCVVLDDATATTSPEGAYENVIYNAGGAYGFVTDTKRVIAAAAKQ